MAWQYWSKKVNSGIPEPTNPFSNSYSFRKTNPSYSGPCIRVRRSSDNTEQDIGWSGDLLDETALLSFVGSNNAFIRTWYDQFGTANLAETTQASQPRIVNAGVVEKFSGKVCAVFLTNGRMVTPFQTLFFWDAASTVNQCHYVTQYTNAATQVCINTGGPGSVYGLVSQQGGTNTITSQGWVKSNYFARINKVAASPFSNRGDVFTKTSGYKIITESRVGAAGASWGFSGYTGASYIGRVFELNNYYGNTSNFGDTAEIDNIQDWMNAFYNVY